MECLDKYYFETVVGAQISDMSTQPIIPYSSNVICFLDSLSKLLLKDHTIRNYPDVVGFGYWCRKSNLMSLARNFSTEKFRIGRGLAFHIAPGNVPVNFAFSLAFGMLSGNSNIVRISDKKFEQSEIIIRKIKQLFALDEYSEIANMTRIVRYERSDEITSAFFSLCQARILWGGDKTINQMKAIPTPPRCVDISFTDRYSVCVLNADFICNLDAVALNNLAIGFYNDVFLLDQNACSSPHLILWQGSSKLIEAAKSIFWPEIERVIFRKKKYPQIVAVEKYAHFCKVAITFGDNVHSFERNGNCIYRLGLKSIPDNIVKHRGKYGFFFEAEDNDIQKLSGIVDQRFQTVTYCGIDPQTIVDKVKQCGLKGIDRVVPVGQALDIGVFWDGYDLINSLSRTVCVV